jgi:CRISPR-associated endonuclease/helicase Cas3
MTIWAHSANRAGQCHALKVHLTSVANLSHKFAERFPWREEARLAGLLHDLGKYGERFQQRLAGEYEGVDHWSAGAWVAARQHLAFAAALAIEGHHIGLQRMTQEALAALDPAKLAANHPLGLTLSDDSLDPLLRGLDGDGLRNVFSGREQTTVLRKLVPNVSSMLDVRMLFSCLTDADFLDTEAHFNGDESGKRYRAPGVALDAARAMERVKQRVAQLAAGTQASGDVNEARQCLWQAALASAEKPPGVFTATAPTGTGKTLALLAMALRHAELHGLRRVIVVLPFLNIIEQTAEQYRSLFPVEQFGEDFVVEHHSLAYAGAERHAEMRGRALAENWDAPIIVTTTVQFFESLFSNRPSAARKLHRIAGSVVLFDEAQTLPAELAVPTLAALSHLAASYGCSAIFATATQPAFDVLHDAVKAAGSAGWDPVEAVPEHARLFARVRRVSVTWDTARETALSELAAAMAREPQGLSIVNTRRQAQALFRTIEAQGDAYYLATNQCAAHRIEVLRVIRERLREGKACRVVATQCVEAGVDIDFQRVWRALAPLDAIAQAAGRCNREGKLAQGQMTVFRPAAADGSPYPDQSYRRAAAIVERLLQHGDIDIYDPQSFRDYFQRLYRMDGTADSTPDLMQAIGRGDFVAVAQHYRLIEERDQVNVLVPHDATTFAMLMKYAGSTGVDARWLRQAQRHAVAVSRKWLEEVGVGVTALRSRYGGDVEGWAVLVDAGRYDKQCGVEVL